MLSGSNRPAAGQATGYEPPPVTARRPQLRKPSSDMDDAKQDLLI